MTFRERKEAFDASLPPAESSLLAFEGVDGYDVYNCSIPFDWEGSTFIFGRVERRGEWARSWSRLFIRTGPDTWRLVPGGMIYQLEDPFISRVGGELILGGTHVRMRAGEIETVYCYFYRGSALDDLYYFTTGPRGMKDIRLVETGRGIGVFSRPRNEKVRAAHGSESIVGFTYIRSLSELTPEVVESAPAIGNMFARGEWGGCNQCYALDTGLIGIIGHKSYPGEDEQGNMLSVYTNVAFVFDPSENRIVSERILATRASFPPGPAKRPSLRDCAFASGIVPRADGRVDLYSGLGDTMEGRVVVDDPFDGFGRVTAP